MGKVIIYTLEDLSGITLLGTNVMAIAGLYLAFVIAFYFLRSFGIYTLAKNAKKKNLKLAFVPFAWIYLAFSLIGKVNFLGRKRQNLGVFALIVFLIVGVLNILEFAICYIPLIGYFLQGGVVEIVAGDSTIMTSQHYRFLSGVYVNGFVSPFSNDNSVITVLNILSFPLGIGEIISIFIKIVLFVNLFKKYSPERHVLMSVLSIMGFFPIFVFSIRKNKPVNYIDYLRSRGFVVYPINGEQNPNNPNNPFAQQNSNDDPFAEFNGQPKNNSANDDPFPEFNDKDKHNGV